MAISPGFLTDWPWKKLGSFKYIILSPWAIHTIYGLATKEKSEIDYLNITIIPFLLWRALHNQIWISFSRHRTAKGNNRIVDKSIEFEQVDRETNWDDQILLNGLLFYIFNTTLDRASKLPIWRTEGIIMTILLHAGPVEYLYYWLHRALHHHYLYSRYHSHHHSSIVTEPISSVIHPFAEHIAYFLLFAIPMLTTVVTNTASMACIFGYITYIDLMNNMGHCNFELIPEWLFSIFPPLKYLMYTPSFHSLHHTQFRTNYSLFMPIYDYIYGTMDKSTDDLYETSLRKKEDFPDVVHLTHLTTPQSIFHLQIGFASFASKPYNSKWYKWLMWPITWWSVVLNLICGCSFIVERNSFEKLRLQSWAIPIHNVQYLVKWQKQAINGLIEEAILEAEARGVKVLSLGLLNQAKELNRNGAIYIEKHPHLNIKVVDGSSLVVAIVLNSIPEGTTEVVFRGKLSKVAYSIVGALCQKGIQVSALYENEYEELKLAAKSQSKMVLSKIYSQKIWLVGDELTEEEQMRAPKGTLFIPFSKFPPKKARNDAVYQYTPAMMAPPSLENLHSCENWLPRKVMSAWRIAGIVHALEGWNMNECGETLFDIDKIWQASLKHGFRPLMFST
ncbi:ECERIFERUM 1-like [Olea europaea subsp. europaea]|uniref:ECERIFERUM 1-like n=1 Tax=Olea europaea subsp. europaea TaxID=158383 RepID=A0A8S0PGS6_OLEEU|nr:ECERIFERUM 1-like [Olea europaea subsp. europaea]